MFIVRTYGVVLCDKKVRKKFGYYEKGSTFAVY